jgi:hypothetical protein
MLPHSASQSSVLSQMSLITEYQATFVRHPVHQIWSTDPSDLSKSSSSLYPVLLFPEISFHVSPSCEFHHCRRWSQPPPGAQRVASRFTSSTTLDSSQASEPQDRRKLYVFLTRGLLSVAYERRDAVFVWRFCWWPIKLTWSTLKPLSLSSQCPMFSLC